jgi:hypothetical protein
MVDSQEPKIFEKTINLISQKHDLEEISKKVDVFGSNLCHYASRYPSSFFMDLQRTARGF